MSVFPKKGISHRRVHFWLVMVIVVFSGTVVFSTYRLTRSFQRVKEAVRLHSELQKAAYDLMNASDFLTEQVQRFTISGDITFLEQYFKEAFESKRREEAIEIMKTDSRTDAAFRQLQEAMDNSVRLMDQEYYAMRLVIEAKGYKEYPEILRNVVLNDEDCALSPEEKVWKATEMVLNDDYYAQKDRIRKGMQESLNEVDKFAESTKEAEYALLNRELLVARIAVLIEAVLVFFMMWLTTHYSISPVIRAIEQVKADLPITEYGSEEFRYLAQVYNKMYEKNKSSLQKLSYKASHDELTGAYNRVGYEHMLSSLDLENTYMMLFDIDDFKMFNDTYGHETGDKVLIKVVNVLRRIFRDDDCICRIGGDEFVVFLVHSGNLHRELIESKVALIYEELNNTEDGMPPISVSIGIISGKDATDGSSLFEKVDKAMYESKNHGKGTYTFYSKGA